jgi:tetratricopeptide (TPR) repeat protein
LAKFFKEMLKSAGPSVARGRDATILREILAKTAVQINDVLKDEPEVRGDLWNTIGATYREIGDHAQAIDAYQHAVDSYRSALGDDNAKLAVSLGGLGMSQSFRGDIATGKANAQLGLELARKCGDADTLASCLVCVARSYRFWGLFSHETEQYWREALAVRKQLGDDPVAIADCMYGLAGSLSDQREASEIMTREVLEVYRQHLGTESPKYANALFVLGQKLAAQEKHEEAEQILRQTRDLWRKVFDANHPYQGIVLRYLLHTLSRRGKWDEVEVIIRQELEASPSSGEAWRLLGNYSNCKRLVFHC